jgi:hypothetical protein
MQMEALMSDRKRSLPEVVLARLSLGAVPVDGIYWYERPLVSWMDLARERSRIRDESGATAADDATFAQGRCEDCI